MLRRNDARGRAGIAGLLVAEAPRPWIPASAGMENARKGIVTCQLIRRCRSFLIR